MIFGEERTSFQSEEELEEVFIRMKERVEERCNVLELMLYLMKRIVPRDQWVHVAGDFSTCVRLDLEGLELPKDFKLLH